MTFEQKPLDFEFDALEPHMDAKTVEIHYTKHHAGYVTKLNAAVEGTEFADMDLVEVVKKAGNAPEDKKTAITNNAGQHLNHQMFWENLSPNGGEEPSGELASGIDSNFESFEKFKEQFSEAAATLFGSGWVFLALNKEGKLEIIKESNAGSPLTDGKTPILVLDVWEHAYYLKFQNKRPDYIATFWNLVNWEAVSERLSNAR